jgi:uncharacterized protein (TIGR02145 family)
MDALGQNTPAESGEFTDSRDGQKYRTVKIGNQVWMAENLNFEVDGSWCYGNDETNGKIYGRLYTWEAVMFACPAGWHLPSREEWAELVNAVGGWKVAGKHLKSKTGWNVCREIENLDTYGFSALPGGLYYRSYFKFAGNYGNWWTATEYGAGHAYYQNVNYNGDSVNSLSNGKRGAFSVRCVRD